MGQPDCSSILAGLQPGDHIRIEWPHKEGPKECYQRKGVVIQATRKLVAIRSPGGYSFCVGVYDLVCGTKITVVRKGVQVA